MASIFGQTQQATQPQILPATAVRLQSSAQGVPISLFLGGQARLSGNVIWYGDFEQVPHVSMSGGGGGGKGGGGQQGSISTTFTYAVSFAMAICYGAIASILSVWNNKAENTPAQLNLAVFAGDYSQAAWGYLTTNHPTEAIPYRGLAYVGAPGFDLGTSQELPQLSFECLHSNANAIPTLPDADASVCASNYLTDPYFSVNFPADRLGDLTAWSAYSRAIGVVVSPVLSNQSTGQQFLSDLCDATNTDPRWSGGVLDFIPRGDSSISANGAIFTADTTPQYDFTYDDYLTNQGSMGQADGPLAIRRKARADIFNVFKVEILDRTNDYNTLIIDDKDEGSIIAFGRERVADVKNFHFICDAAAGRMSVALIKARGQLPRTYQWTAGKRFFLLDVADIVTVTDPGQNISRVPVKIIEITENDDKSLTFTAEDFPGTASAPHYGHQAPEGHAANYNVAPGPVNDPIIFEPTDQLAGALQIWGALSGTDPALWGGCYVLASYDNVTFESVGIVRGGARMGATTAVLAPVDVNPIGQTIDTTHTLSVDLTESAGTLGSGTQADALALNTACYLAGEIVSYKTATLTAQYNYDLTYMVRGGFGTESAIVSHPIGTPFARLDSGIVKIPFDQSRIGSIVYLKFQSFNIWGGGLEDVSALPAYPYTITGVALTSPLPTVINVRSIFNAGFMEIWWDDVQDFRTGVRYKIYKGSTFVGAQQVGDVAHAPFKAFGTGVYWIVAYCQPVPDLYVYSEDPASITVAGNMLITNLVYTSDQRAAGWPGVFSNGVAKVGADPTAFIRLGGGGNILTDSDFLNTPDILNYGGIIASGTYEISPTDYVDVGYVAQQYVNVSWVGVGSPADQDVLAIVDFLNQPDILGSASTQYVNVKIQIATSDTVDGDIFDATDVFDTTEVPDAYSYGIAFGDWQDFVPGIYNCRIFKLRMVLSSIDVNTTALALSFSFQSSVPARIDHYQDVTVPMAGLTITFVPDNSTDIANPFNGGPPFGGTVHNEPLPFINVTWAGHPTFNYVVDDLTLSSVTLHFEDQGGTRIEVDGVNVLAEGY